MTEWQFLRLNLAYQSAMLAKSVMRLDALAKSFDGAKHPRGTDGRFVGVLKTHNELKKRHVEKAVRLSQKGWENLIDNLFAKNYKEIPACVILPKLNENLMKKLRITGEFYITKKRIGHINPDRKAAHGNQEFRIEEYKRIPQMIENAKRVYIDKQEGNFFVAGKDCKDANKINTLVFCKDKAGNVLITIRKVDKESLKSKKLRLVTAGSDPAIASR